MKRLEALTSIAVWKYHGGHALIACGVAFFFVAFGWSVWLGALLGCVGFPLIHETVEVVRGSTGTANWRDHVADLVSYQPAWIVVLVGAGEWAWAGAVLAFLAVAYAATVGWTRPGPKHI